MADNILKVGAIQLPIDPAFTGIESFILLFSLMVVLIYLFELRIPVKIIMLLLCLPLIFIGSVVRILTCILLAQYWSETATILYWNVYSTHTFYLASFLVIGFMWFVLKNIFSPILATSEILLIVGPLLLKWMGRPIFTSSLRIPS